MYRKKNYYNNRSARSHSSRYKGTDSASETFSRPNSEKVSENSELLQIKAFRDLQNIRSIDVKADPYTQMSYGSFPYTIIGGTNRVEDATYPGSDNIAGNTVVQLQNNTTTSSLMNVFDTAVAVLTRNYLYLPIRANGANLAYLTEVCKSVEQAVSFGESTMLTELAFTTSFYDSDMPQPTPYVPPTDSSGTAMTNQNYVSAWSYTVALIHYQTVLQNVVRPISKYVQLRSIEKEAMRMSFRTEAPTITQFYGLLKKKSLVASFNTLSTVVINEYFDSNWYQQSTMVDCYYSRKTKGMVNPLLSLVSVDAIPSLKIFASDSKTLTYNSSSTLVTPGFKVTSYDSEGKPILKPRQKVIDPDTFNVVAFGDPVTDSTGKIVSYTGWSLERLVLNVCKLLDVHYVLTWARQKRVDPSSVYASIDASAYVESIKSYLDAIIDIDTAFSAAMSDIRTFLDKLSQTNLVYWRKGVSFWIDDNINQIDPAYNVLVSNIFAANLSNGSTMEYDQGTKRWKLWTLWNKYEGIPNYDMKSGGSFLTFGLRTLVIDTDVMSMEASEGLIPILFQRDDQVLKEKTNICTATSRSGKVIYLTYDSLTSKDVLENAYLSRLDPLNSGVKIKMPTYTYVSDGSATTSRQIAALHSWVLQFISSVFGYGWIKVVNKATMMTSYVPIIDPDYVCFLDDEIYDVSNDMIKFARNYAPFRVATPDGSRSMGFLKVS